MDMHRQDLTYDEVAAAAEQVRNDGRQVTIDALREVLGNVSPPAIARHLATWRAEHARPPEPPQAQLPPELLNDLARWAQQFAEEAGSGTREALAQHEADMEALRAAGEQLETELTDRDDEIERLSAELRDARQVAMEALVSKAKDQLAIDGKDAQLADLRQQLERNVAASAALSDARLAAEMELIGATTARDTLAAEVQDLRAKLEAARARK